MLMAFYNKGRYLIRKELDLQMKINVTVNNLITLFSRYMWKALMKYDTDCEARCCGFEPSRCKYLYAEYEFVLVSWILY